MSIRHGIRVPTVGAPQDSGTFAAAAERAGFDFLWVPDTPLLAGRWRDAYVHLTCAALQTSRLRLGPGVTNPLTRHPATTAGAILALDEVSGQRADLVAGTGYSAAYSIGKKAATRAFMRESTALWRSILRGEEVAIGGTQFCIEPARAELPIYLAASGPKMLQLAGEIADGVLILVGSAPGTVAWALQQVERGMARAERRREDVERIIVVTTCVDDDRQRVIDQVRPCVASLYRHACVDIFLDSAGLAKPESIPPPPKVYPDVHHAVDWEAAKRASDFVPDTAVEAMMAVGSPADVIDRARALMALDIDAIWWRDEATYTRPNTLMQALGTQVLPALRCA